MTENDYISIFQGRSVGRNSNPINKPCQKGGKDYG